MIFQGQEMLETRAFGFNTATNMNFSQADDPSVKGMIQMYRDLIALRRNLKGTTAGLTGQNLNVLLTWTTAIRRWLTTVGKTGARP